MSKIENELCAATNVAQKDGQEDQTYWAALAKAALKLPDDEFDALSDEAQDWANAAGAQINEAKAAAEPTNIVGFGAAKAKVEEDEDEAEETEESDGDEPEESAEDDDEEESPASGDAEEDEQEEEEEPSAPPPAKKESTKVKDTKKPTAKEAKPAAKPVKAEKPAKAAPKAAKAEPDEKRMMVSHVVRSLCIRHPKKSEVEIKALADAELGKECSMVTFRCHYSGAMGTLRAIEQMGRQVVKVPKPE